MTEKQENIFDLNLFKRLFKYTKPYRAVFYGLIVAVLILGVLSTAMPYLLRILIDDHITNKIEEGFLVVVVLSIIC